jgi:acyl-coenzyme A thioesterase 9
MLSGSSNWTITVEAPVPSPIHHLIVIDPNTVSRKPDNALWMASTEIQSVAIMQPQYRNRHNFMIFGGFLLKSTFELAFTCASATSHTRPTFIALDPSTFENPVPVGSVLYLTATVVYTDSPLVASGDSRDVKVSPDGSTRIQVRVDSKIRNTEHGETKPTGQFNYTFEVKKDIKIVPQTYNQFMMYLDARRRSQRVSASLAGQGINQESVME